MRQQAIIHTGLSPEQHLVAIHNHLNRCPADAGTRGRAIKPSRFSLLCLLVPALIFITFFVEAQGNGVYQKKAVFLNNFAKFTQWPESAFATTNSPIVIGVMGDDPFGKGLQDTIRGVTVNGRPLAIEHYRRAEEIKTCHILFISQSETRRMDDIVKSLKGKPVLTVADADGSAGVIIRFVVEKNKVRFRINAQAATAANLTISAQLLRIADTTPRASTP